MNSFGWTNPNDGGLFEFLRDWWRGYSDADIASAAEKMSKQVGPGQWTEVTDREFKAWRSLCT